MGCNYYNSLKVVGMLSYFTEASSYRRKKNNWEWQVTKAWLSSPRKSL